MELQSKTMKKIDPSNNAHVDGPHKYLCAVYGRWGGGVNDGFGS